eukprot:jgi/Picre1/34408/NNA_001877.t1
MDGGDSAVRRRGSSNRRVSSDRHHKRISTISSRNDTEFEAIWGLSKYEENELLVKFRSQVEESLGRALSPRFDDYYLRRFLRARQHDLKKAMEMFLAHLEWRKEFGADTILEDFLFHERESFLALYPQGYHKVDRLGRPIYIQHLGQINMKALKNITTIDRMIRYHVQEYERAIKYIFPACSRAKGMHISQTLAILDLKGVGLRHLSGEVKTILSTITGIDQANYPETLGKTLIINAPAVFRAIWTIVKPMLDPRTQAKIEVCPSNYMSVLTKWVDVESIPSYLGGKSTGSLIDDVGPWNDPELIHEIDDEWEGKHTVVDDDTYQHNESVPVQIEEEEDEDHEFHDVMVRRDSSVSTMATAYLSADEESEEVSGGALSPLHQVPIIERVKGLEGQVPALEHAMSRDIPKDGPRPSSLIGQGTLVARVAALEQAVSILTETQESLIVAHKTNQSTLKRGAGPACCAIQ